MPIGHGWSVAVRRGIASHHTADAAFHDLPVFRLQSRALTGSLLDTGVPRGAARAIGHAGWELLLDGALLDDGALVAAYLAAMAVPVADADWQRALAVRVSRGVPRIYADPSGVAEVLWRMLGHRRLLAFDRVHFDAVVGCLAAAQPGVAAAVPEVFGSLGE